MARIETMTISSDRRLTMRFRGVGEGKILEEQFLPAKTWDLRVAAWIEAIEFWWADRPRKTWIVAPYEGLFGVFFDKDAAESERRHQNDVLGPGNEWRFSVLKPGPWLRPSQMATLETYHGNGTDRKV